MNIDVEQKKDAILKDIIKQAKDLHNSQVIHVVGDKTDYKDTALNHMAVLIAYFDSFLEDYRLKDKFGNYLIEKRKEK